MRLFIGIELSDGIKTRAADVSADLRARLTKASRRTTLRWVNPENLHITLWFLGEVADEGAAAVASTLRQRFQTPTFDVAISGAGLFPASGLPRTLWLGLTAGIDPLVSLHGELLARLPALGFQPEKRAYSPHLTVARFKDVARPEAAAIRRAVAQTPADVGACPIGAVTLFRSRLSPKPASANATAARRSFSGGGGSQYEPLLRVPLD
jgi:RNA 2',3'-cyclic 3'-phosphodiesterase